MITAYPHQDRARMSAVTNFLSHDAPAAMSEFITLRRTMKKKRAADMLPLSDLPGTSNGPTEVINELLEDLRGYALGFGNLTNYIARSLLEADGFRPLLHPHVR